MLFQWWCEGGRVSPLWLELTGRGGGGHSGRILDTNAHGCRGVRPEDNAWVHTWAWLSSACMPASLDAPFARTSASRAMVYRGWCLKVRCESSAPQSAEEDIRACPTQLTSSSTRETECIWQDDLRVGSTLYPCKLYSFSFARHERVERCMSQVIASKSTRRPAAARAGERTTDCAFAPAPAHGHPALTLRPLHNPRCARVASSRRVDSRADRARGRAPRRCMSTVEIRGVLLPDTCPGMCN